MGEMRDLETTSLSLTAAETGHLVMSTLHTSSAVKAIDRVIDIYPEGQKTQVRSMMSESLVAVIAQKLLPTRDGKGRVPAAKEAAGDDDRRPLTHPDHTSTPGLTEPRWPRSRSGTPPGKGWR